MPGPAAQTILNLTAKGHCVASALLPEARTGGIGLSR